MLLALGVTGGLCWSLTPGRVPVSATSGTGRHPPQLPRDPFYSTPALVTCVLPSLRRSSGLMVDNAVQQHTRPWQCKAEPGKPEPWAHTGVSSRTVRHPFGFGIYSTRESGIRQDKGVGVEPKGPRELLRIRSCLFTGKVHGLPVGSV